MKYAAEGQVNPFPLTTRFPNLLTGRASPALFLLSILIHIDLSTIILLLPILLLLITDPHSHLASPRPLTASLRRTIPLLGEYLFYTFVLAITSTIIAGGVQWVPQTWGATYVQPFPFLPRIILSMILPD